jgi:hypothetical protein
MKSAVQLLLLCLSLFCLFVFPVFAVSVAVTEMPSSISVNPFSVTVSVLGANSGRNYLRVDLFRDGTSNYFGETNNGSEWYFGSTGTSYFPIDIVSSIATATATVQAQIGEPSVTDYAGSGAYKLRIRRYTSASSYSASSAYDITIDVPTPTSTNAPTSTNTPTQTPKPTVTPTLTPTKILATNTPVLTSTPPTSVSPTGITEVLGFSEVQATLSGVLSIKPYIISLLFVSTGLAILSGVFIWQKRAILKR